MSRHLWELSPGETGIIEKIAERDGVQDTLRQRLLELGFVENSKVVCVGSSPSGDPKAYLVRGAVIAVRQKDSEIILIKE